MCVCGLTLLFCPVCCKLHDCMASPTSALTVMPLLLSSELTSSTVMPASYIQQTSFLEGGRDGCKHQCQSSCLHCTGYTSPLKLRMFPYASRCAGRAGDKLACKLALVQAGASQAAAAVLRLPHVQAGIWYDDSTL